MDNKIMIAYYLGRRKENDKTSLFDQLICLATNSRYSHLEYVYSYNPVTGFAYCWSSSPRDGGVRGKTIKLDPKVWELYSVKTDVSISSILNWFDQNKGRKYDWLGALATKLTFLRQMTSRVFCSEAIATVLHINEPTKQTPQSIYTHLYKDSTAISLSFSTSS